MILSTYSTGRWFSRWATLSFSARRRRHHCWTSLPPCKARMSGRPSRFSSGKMPKTRFLPSSEIDRSKDSKLSELLDAIGNYWSDRAQRNRYYHDEWFVVLEEGGIPATRGLPLKKGSDVVFDDPTVEQIWERAA